MASPFWSWRHSGRRAALSCALLLVGTAALGQGAAAVNSIQSIKTAKGGGVDITITSTTGFLQSDLPVLRIGDREFTISRYPEDGSPYTLIFTLTADDFDRIRTGEKVMFQYGPGEGRNERDFGVLDKSKRDK